MIKKIIQMLAGLTLATGAMAGSVEGPYVVWINLSEHPRAVDDRVRKFINSDAVKRNCWGYGALMFMRAKPPEITPELARAALLRKDRKAVAVLRRILKKPFGDEATDGFDGVIAYEDSDRSSLHSLSRDGKAVSASVPGTTLEAGLCAVMPAIERAP